MRYLLDTHILLWSLKGSDKLSKKARDIISNPNNELFFSSVSVWEIAIKLSRGHFTELIEPSLFYKTLILENYQELLINSHHTITVKSLPFFHKDPFDRMLIAQSYCENLTLMTVDDKIAQYDGQIIMV